ncbi:hypothetical protein AGABI2DRAFT_198050 [Agaricus bisporus var. bisporus H97]|uniref:hypothetical protein n=1 Tax=Agaricus bisporus var. bisporus (strain H97 / ATCC MYA-4626 / FGSC 10389) TaxID=936046 RepID=UPI00029F6EEC|nr:hypothetical protein AGABI2DRAFT_198050 [Agaricus bisporus var. bisporus H97]EKV51675.1 hypothetical protein AGABI2DRAFT_198050 [Agaricus bisporus var. bisporus H97]
MRLSVCLAALLARPALALSSTITDVLSADPDYEALLRLLQRTRLIPTLNTLPAATLFAPTNDAISKHDLWAHALDDAFVLTDNVNEQLRQQLFYHMLNFSIAQGPAPEQSPPLHTFDTLLYPHKPLDPPSHEPPPHPPWMPIPSGTLGEKSQRLRAVLADDNQKGRVAVDAFGKGGADIVKPIVNATNGAVLGISDVLIPPLDLATVVSAQQSLSYFRRIVTPHVIKFLNSTSELTLFLPVDNAWDQLNKYERIYLESEFASDDLSRIFNMHAVAKTGVKWSDSFTPGINLSTIDGTTLEVVTTTEGTKVSGGDLVHPDIYASNGVLHLVSSLLIPEGALQITPEKYLLALNCTSFVSMLRSVNLTDLIRDTEQKYTILAPQDDVLDVLGDSDLPEKGSPELKKLLQYHFVPGHWTAEKLENGMLLETTLEEEGLKGGKQVLSVDVHHSGKDSKGLQFAGASVIGDPIELDNILVYFLSRPIVPPSDSISTALPSLDLSNFLAALLSSSQSDIIRTTPRTSLLIPYNSAFKRLGLLVSAHLLSTSYKQDLEKVILHHTLSDVEYSSNLVNGSQQTFQTLEGSDIKLERMDNGTVLISPSGGWPGMKSRLVPRDTLTQTGVIHELSDILLPRSVDITIGKLMKAAKGSTMTSLFNRAGFEWILNGTAPPDDWSWPDEKNPGGGIGWTVLCPTDDAFKNHNLTELFANPMRLKSIVMQHIILSPYPKDQRQRLDARHDFEEMYNNQPLVLEDTATYSTLRDNESFYGDIVFKSTGAEEDGTTQFIVGIKDARGTDGSGDWAKVLGWGRSTTSAFPTFEPTQLDSEPAQMGFSTRAGFIGGAAGGVIQIDRLILPYEPPWWISYGAPSVVGFAGMSEQKVSATENIKAFIAGGFGGASAVLVGHPFDLTKTRLQTAAPGVYTGAVDVVKKTLAKDGISGMYRGMVPPLLGVTPIFAVSFWAYDVSKQLIFALTPDRTHPSLSTAELAAAGFLSAVPTTLITAPVERAKVLLQIQGQGGKEVKYKGVTDVLKHLYKEGGMRSIFRGTGATLARDGPGSAAYFASYEVTKKFLTPSGSSPADLNLGAIILAGGTAGVAMWAIAIPPDVLKSRLQSAPNGTYSGFLDCARKTIAADGVGALWKGFGPAMARAFPANAATFLGVEASRKLMDRFF